jgi:hypothetical protein
MEGAVRKMKKSFALTLVLVLALTFTGPVLAQDSMNKVKNTVDKVSDVLKNIGDIFDAGKTVVDEVNKVGSITDPRMNPQYVALKRREIQRALRDYQDAKDRYEDTASIRLFARSNRKKEMNRAREEYLDKVETFAKAQADFQYDVYINTDSYMTWRKPARKKNYHNALRDYTEFMMSRADTNVKRTRKEYDDEWWIFFISKIKKKNAYEKAKKDRDEMFDRVEDIWRDAGLFSDSGWFNLSESIPESQPGAAGGDVDGSKIELKPKPDM